MNATAWTSQSSRRLPSFGPSPLEDWTHRFRSDGQLLIKRDDLLPFPAAGNKVRKLVHELDDPTLTGRTLLTVGAVSSNHCRTTALMAARLGLGCHLILHTNDPAGLNQQALRLLTAVGATTEIVDPANLPTAIRDLRERYGETGHWIEGGCHTPRGVQAYVAAVEELAQQLDSPPDLILVACGTGATHAGIILGCRRLGWPSRVVGVSVARNSVPATRAVREALAWLDAEAADGAAVEVDDRFRAGGYGQIDRATRQAVDIAWRQGLPLDPTYMGKAFARYLAGSSVNPNSTLLWHTGGLLNFVTAST